MDVKTDQPPMGPIVKKAVRLLNWLRRHWMLFGTVALVAVVISVASAEYITSRPAFCGSCHIMDKYHKQWAKSKHAEEGVTCVECHYIPGGQHTLKAKFKGMGQLFSYLGSESRMVEKAALVNDESCVHCHPIDEKVEEGAWLTKKLTFATTKGKDGAEKKVPFVHKTHFEQKNWEEGQEKHCSICHRHRSSEKHIEVSADTCNLCHFKNVELNKKQSKCSLCHEIPTKPFREDGARDGVMITHKVLEERGVACASCHQHNVRGTGATRKERCLECHESSKEIMARAGDKKYMHEKHVSAQTADCFSCHERVEHGAVPKNYNHYNASLNDCRQCHTKPHSNKVSLLSGTGGKGMDKPLPIKHHTVKMNCRACHIVDATDAKGRPKKLATASVCINCHSEKEGALIKKWKDDVADFLEEAKEYEAEAVKALATAKTKVSKETLAKAQKLIAKGQENVQIVNAGGGVHNKKFSVLLLDVAIECFEDATDQLKED
jgi:nitrate/TMAO reductase-like tetraheme cytochrome c subunit